MSSNSLIMPLNQQVEKCTIHRSRLALFAPWRFLSRKPCLKGLQFGDFRARTRSFSTVLDLCQIPPSEGFLAEYRTFTSGQILRRVGHPNVYDHNAHLVTRIFDCFATFFKNRPQTFTNMEIFEIEHAWESSFGVPFGLYWLRWSFENCFSKKRALRFY